jgi:hypothetical protein
MFILKCLKGKKDQQETEVMLDKWKAHILDQAKPYLEGLERGGLQVSLDMQKHLSFLKEHLVIGSVDKAASNYFFCCKRMYADVLRTELNIEEGGTNAYERVEMNEETVIKQHKAFLKPLCLWNDKWPESLPYLYWNAKLHKTPTGYRFIAGSGQVTTTILSKMLSDIFNFVFAELRKLDDKLIVDTGVRKFFVVNGYEEVTLFLSKWSPYRFESVQTGDFSTMYTHIPHDDLKRVMREVLTKVWTAASADTIGGGMTSLYIKHASGNVEWHKPRASVRSKSVHYSGVHVMSLNDLHTLICWQVDNVFIANGGVVHRQKVGIPMGTNDGPPMANGYLYWYEDTYIEKIRLESLERAQKFHMSFRLIDDTLSIDNSVEWTKATEVPFEEGGMYPRALTLNNTSISNTVVNFLGVRLEVQEGGTMLTDIYDKRKDFDFHVQRYPDMRSFIPANIPYGVFVGLLFRTYRICSNPSRFSMNARVLMNSFVSKGCKLSRLYRLLHNFLESKSPLRWKVPWWTVLRRTVRLQGNKPMVAGAADPLLGQEPDLALELGAGNPGRDQSVDDLTDLIQGLAF